MARKSNKKESSLLKHDKSLLKNTKSTTSRCLPNIFFQFQGFQGVFLNFLAVLQGFLVKFVIVFKVLLKNFIRFLLTDSKTSERISISEDSQT